MKIAMLLIIIAITAMSCATTKKEAVMIDGILYILPVPPQPDNNNHGGQITVVAPVVGIIMRHQQ